MPWLRNAWITVKAWWLYDKMPWKDRVPGRDFIQLDTYDWVEMTEASQGCGSVFTYDPHTGIEKTYIYIGRQGENMGENPS